MAGLAELPDADWSQTDVTSRSEAEDKRISDDESFDDDSVIRVVQVYEGCWKPKHHRRGGAKCEGADHRIEAPKFVSDITRSPSSETRPSVENGKEVVGERSRKYTSGCSVRSEVCNGYKQAPFHEVDAQSKQKVGCIPEDGEIRYNALSWLGREA